MKRTDITNLFPEATKEQIDQLMDLNGADVLAAKGEYDGLKAQIEDMKRSMDSVNSLKAAKKQAEEEKAQLQAEVDGLKKANEIRGIREKVAEEKNIPFKLLTGETEEACAAQADAMLAWGKSLNSPSVPDGGEPKTPPATSARDLFSAWADKNL